MRDKNLGYIKTILRGVKGLIPNDIYLDEELNQIVIPTKSGCNITQVREDIIDRLKNTWIKDYVESFKYSYGDYIMKLKTSKNECITESLQKVINEALELNVVKDGDLKLPIDQVVVTNYDEVVGYAGRARKPMVNWVTQYDYVSKENLTQEQFDEKIKEAGHTPYGMISYKKRKLTYGNGEIYYRHICKSVMF